MAETLEMIIKMRLDMFCARVVQGYHCRWLNLTKTLKHALTIYAEVKKSKSITSIFALYVSFKLSMKFNNIIKNLSDPKDR